MKPNTMIRNQVIEDPPVFTRPEIAQHKVDWPRLVQLDFETYYDDEYTLKKLSTSEYVRDPRFKAQMVGIKIGNRKTKIYGHTQIRRALQAIDWSTHSLLSHNTQFDGFILSHHYNIHPKFLYDTLAMARGLHSNEIGAGLDEVSQYYDGQGKIDGVLEHTKGVRDWPAQMFAQVAVYCANDVEEMARIFRLMVPKLPDDEFHHIDWITRCFTSPVLRVDIPRVERELERELAHREQLMYAAVDPSRYDVGGDLYDRAEWMKLLTKKERELEGKERDLTIIKRIIGSNERFSELLRAEGVEPPKKKSAAWLKKDPEDRDPTKEFTEAFAKDDQEFLELPNQVDEWGFDRNDPEQVKLITARQERLQTLVDVRLAIKSTTNITRAERFLKAGANGWPLPVGYSYSRAHTHRLGGNNKMNMQNLKRGGELRRSILAPPGHVIVVCDSGQIEARVNAWLWGQTDLLDAFRKADGWDKKTMGVARGNDRDAYCRFADLVYNREITTENSTERFVGKVCVLGLGYQMGASKLQITLAKGALGGPPVFFSLRECEGIVSTYRSKNWKIRNGWGTCQRIIEDMAAGREGSLGPLNWERGRIWLPNGMCLQYPGLRASDDGFSYQSGDMRKKIYGGLLCENIVQALARIIVLGQILLVSRRYRIVLTTHDEGGAVAPEVEGAECFKFMTQCFRTAPDWCRDLPLNSEGGYAVDYSK